MSSTPELNQATIDVVQRFLLWAFFKAKSSKCVSMAMKRFDPRYVPTVDYKRLHEVQYSPFDPELTIAGEKIRFIVNVAVNPNSLQYDHFKELGRFISVDLTEDKIRHEIRKRHRVLTVSANSSSTSTSPYRVCHGLSWYMTSA